MKLIFLQDFQGRETHGQFFLKGETAEFEREAALVLIQDKRAEEVTPPKVETVSELVQDEPKKKVKK